MFLSSYAISTNASRACSRILEIHARRGGLVAIPQAQVSRFVKAGVIVMLSIWRAKQTGIPLNEEKEMEAFYRCVRDVLRALAAASNLPFDPAPTTTYNVISLSPGQPDLAPIPLPDDSYSSHHVVDTSDSGSDSIMFDFPVHSNQLSRPIFQTYYQGSHETGNNTFQHDAGIDDFEAMFGGQGVSGMGGAASANHVGMFGEGVPSVLAGSSGYGAQVAPQQSVMEGVPLYDTSAWGADFDADSWAAYFSHMQAMGF
ncbi:hypothetical protein BKA70DRAFT_1316520 [Coprinopsis sp. MPI-PUGE-AT-0042]|nr:hypothetical protein BKA70DRAFT_1316520 [Coprinopsis sp. MPI-PUGE-AT-0042]